MAILTGWRAGKADIKLSPKEAAILIIWATIEEMEMPDGFLNPEEWTDREREQIEEQEQKQKLRIYRMWEKFLDKAGE